jgi:asparagine synthase (glutamine-hydrolysing)
MQRLLLNNGHVTVRAEAWAASGARHGIEYRYPLLDRRLLEFGLGIPPDQLVGKGWNRYLFRRAVEGMLPDDIRWRRSKVDPAARSAAQQLALQVPAAMYARLGNRLDQHPASAYVDITRLATVVSTLDDPARAMLATVPSLACFLIEAAVNSRGDTATTFEEAYSDAAG